MFCERTYFYGVHAFQDDMYYGSICLKGGHVFIGGHVLWEDNSCMSACLQGAISVRMMCLTGIHVLWEDRSYLRVCPIGDHV